MSGIEIALDRALFGLDVVARTAHRYTDAYFVEIVSDSTSLVVRLTPRDPSESLEYLEQRFRNDALDDRLRAKVHADTHELHTALVEAALSRARPRAAGDP
jgi:His-Xaa-Ser system protein HxsD